MILQTFYNPKALLIACGNNNKNNLNGSDRMRQLKTVLNLYSMLIMVTFPTRIGKGSIYVIDNILIDRPKFDNYKIFPLNNGLSDHDAQIKTIHIPSNQSLDHQTYFKRKINK
jgi:hypothetical protein